MALVQYSQNENAEFSNFVRNTKNICLAYSAVDSENVAYSSNITDLKDCFDVLYLQKSELCYENIDGSGNYRSAFLHNSHGCVESSFLFDCANCKNCFMSSGLRNKSYVFRNKQLTKTDYEAQVGKINLGSYETLRQMEEEYRKIAVGSLHKFSNQTKASDCTGDNIWNSKNVTSGFGVHEVENVKFVGRAFNLKDSYDIYGSSGKELNYESVVTGWSTSKTAFCTDSDAAREMRYCHWCHSSSNLFGCIGLRSKQYCILNRQYTKEEYEALVPKIIEQMNAMPYVDARGRVYKYGEFFPPELSPFAYNEALSQEYFPLTKKDAIERGYRWRDLDAKSYTITKEPENLPDQIKDIDESVLKETIGCLHGGDCNDQCTTAFRIIPEELAFYRKIKLALPRLCPNCRHYERLKQRNPLKLWHRKCVCVGAASQGGVYQNTAAHPHGTNSCPNEFETSYAPDRPEIVYCESCYNSEIA